MWVANSRDATVWRIDPATNRVVATITVGEGPSGVAVAPGGTSVWVSNALSGTLSKIDPTVGKVVKSVPVGDQPQGVAVSADAAYVAVQGSGERPSRRHADRRSGESTERLPGRARRRRSTRRTGTRTGSS